MEPDRDDDALLVVAAADDAELAQVHVALAALPDGQRAAVYARIVVHGRATVSLLVIRLALAARCSANCIIEGKE